MVFNAVKTLIYKLCIFFELFENSGLQSLLRSLGKSCRALGMGIPLSLSRWIGVGKYVQNTCSIVKL